MAVGRDWSHVFAPFDDIGSLGDRMEPPCSARIERRYLWNNFLNKICLRTMYVQDVSLSYINV